MLREVSFCILFLLLMALLWPSQPQNRGVSFIQTPFSPHLPDESDLRIVRRIIEAAIWYTLSERVELPLPPDLMA